MTIRDFAGFKKPTLPMDVPIIGQTPPAVLLDALGRPLQSGDFLILQTPVSQPYRVQSVTPAPPQPGAPPLMQVVLSSTVSFLAPRGMPQSEFLRVMTREEVDVRRAAGQASAPIDRPQAEPVGTLPPEPTTSEPPELDDDPSQTLKDA